MLRLETHLQMPAFATGRPAWAPGALADQQTAGAILWTVAELLDLPFLVLAVRQWTRVERREAQRIDADLDRAAPASPDGERPRPRPAVVAGGPGAARPLRRLRLIACSGLACTFARRWRHIPRKEGLPRDKGGGSGAAASGRSLLGGSPHHRWRHIVIILGVILLVLGLLLPALHVLLWIGIVLLVIGAVLALMGTAGRAVGGRRHWY